MVAARRQVGRRRALIAQGTTDPTSQITQALSSHPQALMVLAVGTLGQTIVQKLAAQGASMPMFSNVASGAYTKQIQDGKLDSAYTAGVYSYSPEWKAVQKKLYPKGHAGTLGRELLHRDDDGRPSARDRDQQGYGSDGAAVQKVLSEPSQSYTGCCGRFAFAAGHSAPGEFAVMHSSGGSAFKQVASSK